jgi:hypothetical protein
MSDPCVHSAADVSEEWAKNSIYNLALHWVLEQALARMTAERTFASEVAKNDS